MKPATLRNVLDEVLRLSVSSPLLLGAACGPDVSLYELPRCTPGGQLSIQGLQPASPVDYAELRLAVEPGAPGSGQVLDSFGSKCATATNRAACDSALAMVKSDTGFY